MGSTLKPEAKLIGENGNIFVLIGIAKEALVRAGQKERFTEMMNRILESKGYHEALVIMGEYVEIV